VRLSWLVLVVALTACQQPEKGEKIKEVPLGYTGEARLNPYLAAEKYLSEKGWSVESSRSWSNSDFETSIIFMPGSFLETDGMGIRVLDWVSDGGTLVLSLEGGEPERNDFTDRSSGWGLSEEDEFTGLNYVLEMLEISIEVIDWSDFVDDETELAEDGYLSRPWHLTKLREERGGHRLEIEGDLGFATFSNRHWDFEVDGISRLAGSSYGSGQVVLLSHARPLRSPYLARADHAAFLEMLAESYGDGGIVFLYGSSNSFFELIWKEGRMVVIAGFVLLVCWLWMRIPRFGPILQDLAVKRRPYGDELKASARFLWRTGQLEHLLRPLRARLEKENQSDPESLYDQLAGESDLERSEVAEALTIDAPKDPGHTLKVVQKLKALLKR